MDHAPAPPLAMSEGLREILQKLSRSKTAPAGAAWDTPARRAISRKLTASAEVARLISLGAARIDIGQGDVDLVVLADPDDNECCVLTSSVETKSLATG